MTTPTEVEERYYLPRLTDEVIRLVDEGVAPSEIHSSLLNMSPTTWGGVLSISIELRLKIFCVITRLGIHRRELELEGQKIGARVETGVKLKHLEGVIEATPGGCSRGYTFRVKPKSLHIGDHCISAQKTNTIEKIIS